MVLEDLDRAKARGASIYAELAGHGATCEAYHPTSPEPEGHAIAETIRAALNDAQVPAQSVDHINAHATGTVHNDRAEARAFYRVFGDRAKSMPINGIKSMVGHCLGAGGAIEAATLAMTIARGIIPPTVNHRETDPDCALDVVPNDGASRPRTLRCLDVTRVWRERCRPRHAAGRVISIASLLGFARRRSRTRARSQQRSSRRARHCSARGSRLTRTF